MDFARLCCAWAFTLLSNEISRPTAPAWLRLSRSLPRFSSAISRTTPCTATQFFPATVRCELYIFRSGQSHSFVDRCAADGADHVLFFSDWAVRNSPPDRKDNVSNLA